MNRNYNAQRQELALPSVSDMGALVVRSVTSFAKKNKVISSSYLFGILFLLFVGWRVHKFLLNQQTLLQQICLGGNCPMLKREISVNSGPRTPRVSVLTNSWKEVATHVLPRTVRRPPRWTITRMNSLSGCISSCPTSSLVPVPIIIKNITVNKWIKRMSSWKRARMIPLPLWMRYNT